MDRLVEQKAVDAGGRDIGLHLVGDLGSRADPGKPAIAFDAAVTPPDITRQNGRLRRRQLRVATNLRQWLVIGVFRKSSPL